MYNCVKEKINKICNWIDDNPDTAPNMSEFMECLWLCSLQDAKERGASLMSFQTMYQKRFGEKIKYEGSAMWQLFDKVMKDVLSTDKKIPVEEAGILIKFIGVGQYLTDGGLWNNEEEKELLEQMLVNYEGDYGEELRELLADINFRELANFI